MDRPMSALEAMKLSGRENRIVHLKHSTQLAADLLSDCDDRTEGTYEDEIVHEFWGDGWRVHLYEPRS